MRWPARLMIPLGFALLALQGLSEIIKRVAFLAGIAAEPPRPGAEGMPPPADHPAADGPGNAPA